jgi:acyl-coenzyme A synthetase/AMP-(fatty) acid ligase
LFEIEKAILSLENIQQAAVLLCDSSHSEVSELVAFIAGSDLMDLDMIMEDLGRAVPSYMLPKRIIPLTKIPLTDRGKTDRAALRDFYQKDIQVSGKGDKQ